MHKAVYGCKQGMDMGERWAVLGSVAIFSPHRGDCLQLSPAKEWVGSFSSTQKGEKVQPVTWGGGLGGDDLSGHRSAGEQSSLRAGALGTHPST